MAEDVAVPLRWVLLFVLVVLLVLAATVQFVGGSLIASGGLLVLPL